MKSESLLAAKVVVLRKEVIRVNDSVTFFFWDILFWATSKSNLMINLPPGNAYVFLISLITLDGSTYTKLTFYLPLCNNR